MVPTRPIPNMGALRAYVEKETQRRADVEYARIMVAGRELVKLCLALDADWTNTDQAIYEHIKAQIREQVTVEVEQQYGSICL